MGSDKQIVVLFMFVFILAGCSNKEPNDLKSATQIKKTMEQDIAKSNEAAEYHYQRGIEALNSGAYYQAKGEFEIVISKFPSSALFSSAKQQLLKIQPEIEQIDKIDEANKKISSVISEHKEAISNAISEQKFDAAIKELNGIKDLISEDSYKEILQRIDDEKNKLMDKTINRLISDFGIPFNHSNASELAILGKRVRFSCHFSSYVARDIKALYAYDDPSLLGSHIAVVYNGANSKDFFIQYNPQSDQRYLVTGIAAAFTDTGALFIKAEKIDPQ